MAQKALLPLFPLELVLLPAEPLPLYIFEPRYRRMISDAHAHGTEFGIVWQTDEGAAATGCSAAVEAVTERFDDGSFNVRVIGKTRFDVESWTLFEGCVHAKVEFFHDEPGSEPDAEVCASLLEMADELRRFGDMELPVSEEPWRADLPGLSFRIARDLHLPAVFRQVLLEDRSEARRSEILATVLEGLLEERAKLERRSGRASGNGNLVN